MRGFLRSSLLAALLILPGVDQANAQTVLVAIRSNETVSLRIINWVTTHDCESQLVSVDGVEVLEGPSDIKVEFRPRKVLATSAYCRKEVDGGEVVAIAKQIKQKFEAGLVFRVLLTTKTGPAQITQSYRLLLFP
jgi:hypothetical protein